MSQSDFDPIDLFGRQTGDRTCIGCAPSLAGKTGDKT